MKQIGQTEVVRRFLSGNAAPQQSAESESDPFFIPDFLRRSVTPENLAAMKRIAQAEKNRREGRNIKMPKRRKRAKPTGLGMSLKDTLRVVTR